MAVTKLEIAHITIPLMLSKRKNGFIKHIKKRCNNTNRPEANRYCHA